MSSPRRVTHGAIMDAINLVGKLYAEGICFAYAEAAARFINEGNKALFTQLIEWIGHTPDKGTLFSDVSAEYCKALEQAQSKRLISYTSTLTPIPIDDNKPLVSSHNELSEIFLKQWRTELPTIRASIIANFSEEMRMAFLTRPLLEEMKVYQDVHEHPELFPPDEMGNQAHDERIAALFAKNPNEKESVRIGEFTGIYSISDLVIYFSSLADRLKHAPMPIPLLITGICHAATIEYDKDENGDYVWFIYEANEAPYVIVDTHEKMALCLMASLCSIFYIALTRPAANTMSSAAERDSAAKGLDVLRERFSHSHVAMETRINVNRAHANTAKGIIDDWMNSEAFEQIHTINPERAHRVDKKGGSWLYMAVLRDQTSLVKSLLKLDASPNTEHFKFSTTPLHSALWNDNLAIAEALYNSGADVNHRARKGITPFLIAVQRGHNAMVKRMLERANLEATLYPKLSFLRNFAMLHGRGAEVENLFFDRYQEDHLSTYTNRAWNALDFAAFFGRADVVETLLQAGMPVAMTTSTDRYSALDLAIAMNHTVVIKALEQAKKIPAWQTEAEPILTGDLLHTESEMLASLSELKNIICSDDKNSNFLLTFQVYEKRNRSIEDFHVMYDPPFATWQLINSSRQIIKIIPPGDLAKVIMDMFNESLLLYYSIKINIASTQLGNEHIAYKMSDWRAFESSRDYNRKILNLSLLAFAIKTKKYKTAEMLMRAGASLNVAQNNCYPLQVAYICGDNKLFKCLLEHGADPDLPRDTNGNTLLITAIKEKQEKMVGWLLEHGADFNIPAADDGCTPLQIARALGLYNILTLLTNAIKKASLAKSPVTLSPGALSATIGTFKPPPKKSEDMEVDGMELEDCKNSPIMLGHTHTPGQGR